MGCNKAAGEYYIDFGNKSELNPPYYINQIPMNQDNTGFAGQCTHFINDRMRQICGFKMESLAGGWGDGGGIWKTAQKFGFPVYNAQQALEKRGTLAGYIISFESGVKSGYGTHTAVVESYDKANKMAYCSELWGSYGDCVVHLTPYYENELFNVGMHFIDFSSVGMTVGETMTDDEVRQIYAAYKAEKVYNTVDDVPDFAKETVRKLIEKGLLVGEGENNLNLTYDLCRILVINNRAGLYD